MTGMVSTTALGARLHRKNTGDGQYLVGAFPQMYLPQVRCKLGLLISAACYIVVRHHHFAPRFEIARRDTFDGAAGRLALFATHLLVKLHTQQFLFHLLNLVRLRSRYG